MKQKDRSVLESTLSDDFTFASPHDAISADTAHR
jgi:hypothetical protein